MAGRRMPRATLARHTLEHFEARGIDATESPTSQLKRRLISLQEIAKIAKAGPSAEDLALVDPGPSDALLAFERAIGVPQDDPPPAWALVRMPA